MERPKLIRQYTGCIPNTRILDPMMDQISGQKLNPIPKLNSVSLSDTNFILNHPFNKPLFEKQNKVRSKT